MRSKLKWKRWYWLRLVDLWVLALSEGQIIPVYPLAQASQAFLFQRYIIINVFLSILKDGGRWSSILLFRSAKGKTLQFWEIFRFHYFNNSLSCRISQRRQKSTNRNRLQINCNLPSVIICLEFVEFGSKYVLKWPFFIGASLDGSGKNK